MEVEFVKKTPGGMVLYRIDGKTTYTTPGSYVEKVIKRLSELQLDYFTTTEIAKDGEDKRRISEALSNLYKRGILARSRGYIGFGNEVFYIYFSHAHRELHDVFVEEYLEKHLPAEISEIYRELKYNLHVWSNYDIRTRYGAVDLSLLENYVRNGLLKNKHVKEHNGEYVHATFYWALDAKEEFIDSIIKDKLAEIRQQRTERIGKGKKFEAELEELFGYAFKHDGLVFRIYDHNRQVRKIIRGKLRIFDLVAYAMPYIRMGDKWQRLKWFHGSIPIVFEFKFNEAIGAGWLATFVQEVQWAYGEHAIPALVIGGESGRIYDSAWEYAKRAGNVWIIHGSQLEKLRKYFKEEVEASEPSESHSSPSEIAEGGEAW
ncbi:MAG: hypothetical protein GXO66_03960 [Euryarchaeota archaeon]|nr:hypothetical protein [Euryarchaeota archaeon]